MNRLERGIDRVKEFVDLQLKELKVDLGRPTKEEFIVHIRNGGITRVALTPYVVSAYMPGGTWASGIYLGIDFGSKYVSFDAQDKPKEICRHVNFHNEHNPTTEEYKLYKKKNAATIQQQVEQLHAEFPDLKIDLNKRFA